MLEFDKPQHPCECCGQVCENIFYGHYYCYPCWFRRVKDR